MVVHPNVKEIIDQWYEERQPFERKACEVDYTSRSNLEALVERNNNMIGDGPKRLLGRDIKALGSSVRFS